EDETEAREARHALRGGLQMAGVDEDVVGEVLLLREGKAFPEVVAQEKAVVRLALDDVAEADELPLSPEAVELGRGFRRAQVDPTDHSQDEGVLPRELQHPPRLPEALAALGEDRSLEAGVSKQRLEVPRHEVAADGRHVRADPVVFDGIVLPEMLVGVDMHRAQRAERLRRASITDCRPLSAK